MPLAAALASGLPLVIAVYFGRLDNGLVAIVLDAVVIGVAVGASLVVAQALGLPRHYWVPVSCLAVIRGVSLRAVWTRQLHRVSGTGLGLALAWGLLSMPLNQWSIALTLMLLAFIIEFVVVRHYVIALMLITPLTILLAEATVIGNASPAPLIEARPIDTVLGCAMGLAGGFCLHKRRFRGVAGRQLRRFVPASGAA
jgi:uncharacterized membrane protein YccC